MAMTKREVLWPALRGVLFSYLHKMILLLVAVGGFFALYQLGVHKDRFDEKERWKASDLPNLFIGNLNSVKDCVKANIRKTGYATRSDLIAAMQEKAESCIWQKFEDETAALRDRITSIEKDKQPNLVEYDQLLNSLEKREVYTRSKVISVRQQLSAMLREEPSMDPDRSVFESMLDEESGAHILYQVLWYGSLLFGIAGSTLLLVVVITAFPITNGEGYWTQRIGQILDRIPGSANRTIAVPLLAAAIGGSTLAGAVMETRPGGEARTYDQRVYITDGTSVDQAGGDSVLTSSYEDGDWAYHDGDMIFVDRRKPANPIDIKWERVTQPLKDIYDKTGALVEKTGEGSQNIVTAIQDVNNEVRVVVRTVQDADARLGELERRLQGLETTSGYMLGCLSDIRPVVRKAADLETLVQDQADYSKDVARFSEHREVDQLTLSTDSLARSAEVDPRKAFARTFLWTVYKVGPSVPRIFRERLRDDPDRDGFVAAVTKMQAEPPKGKREFRVSMRKYLEEQNIKGPRQGDLMDKHFRSLLRVCALAR